MRAGSFARGQRDELRCLSIYAGNDPKVAGLVYIAAFAEARHELDVYPSGAGVPTRAAATISQQEALFLRPYVDFLMNDDVEGLYNLARHSGIELGGDLAGTVLNHYRLGDGRYDIERALEDFASRPLLPEIT